MHHHPISQVTDAPLSIGQSVLDHLLILRHADKFRDLPGVGTADESARLSAIMNDILDRLMAGLQANPGKLWVLTEFERGLTLVADEDTEAREHFGTVLETVMDVVGIESSDGLLAAYLGGI